MASFWKRGYKGRPAPHGCQCDFNFTCRVCLQAAADRNMADRNNSPLAWTQPPKKTN